MDSKPKELNYKKSGKSRECADCGHPLEENDIRVMVEQDNKKLYYCHNCYKPRNIKSMEIKEQDYEVKEYEFDEDEE